MHGPCLSLAGADGIGSTGSDVGVAWPATGMRGMRAGHAAPAISPRRFRGRHRAACFARLSAGLRAHGSDTDVRATAAAASQDHRPSACATASPSTAAGQRRVWRHPHGRAPDRLPFSSPGRSRANRPTQHSVEGGLRQHEILCRTQKERRCSRWLLIVSICEPAYLHGFVTARRFRAAGDRDART